MIPHIHSLYDKPEDPGIDFPEPTLTQQHFQEECDLNLIMARAMDTGELPPPRPTFYGDFTDVTDYQSTLAKIQSAHEQFQAMPAQIRDYFRNDPAQMLDFISHPENIDHARALGIFEPLPVKPSDPPPAAIEAQAIEKP